MLDKSLSSLKGHYALQVYEKFKEKVFYIQGFFSEDALYQQQLFIDLLENNIDPDETTEQ